MKFEGVYEPVTQETDEDLTDNNTRNLEVVDGGNPVLVANLVGLPAGGEGFTEQGADVADRKQDITRQMKSQYRDTNIIFHEASLPRGDIPLETQTSSRKDGILEVVADGRQRIGLEHIPQPSKLFLSLGTILRDTELHTLADREVRPVSAIRGIGISGADDLVEGGLLVDLHLLEVSESLLGSLHVNHCGG
jgi:hypothetical protein